jgi:hypothetical protein
VPGRFGSMGESPRCRFLANDPAMRVFRLHGFERFATEERYAVVLRSPEVDIRYRRE